MARITQQSPAGLPMRRYGSFANKAVPVVLPGKDRFVVRPRVTSFKVGAARQTAFRVGVRVTSFTVKAKS